MSVADSLALGLSAAGLASLVLATVFAGHWRIGLSFAIDLWVGAGLLRLVGDLTWRRLVTAATIVALRHLVGYGITVNQRSRHDDARAGPAKITR